MFVMRMCADFRMMRRIVITENPFAALHENVCVMHFDWIPQLSADHQVRFHIIDNMQFRLTLLFQ